MTKNIILHWKYFFYQEKKKLFTILKKINQIRSYKSIYPPRNEVFNAFYYTPFNKIKVVIIGQDPYYKKGQAHGLAFSVRYGCNIPPSLRNIYKEITSDLFLSDHYYRHGCLYRWALQGVLLLNSTLTVEANRPRSHISYGWNNFTDSMIYYINKYLNKIIFLLWGKDAKEKSNIINIKKHVILYASHPSPLSAYLGFFGCRHFSKVNKILLKSYQRPIIW